MQQDESTCEENGVIIKSDKMMQYIMRIRKKVGIDQSQYKVDKV